MEELTLVVTEAEEGRIDKYLAENMPDYTRSFIQKQIEQGNITVNEKVINARYKVKKGD